MGRHGELFVGSAQVSPALSDSPPTTTTSRPLGVLEPSLTTTEGSVTLFCGGAAPIYECPFTDVGEWAFVFRLGPGGIEKREMSCE